MLRPSFAAVVPFVLALQLGCGPEEASVSSDEEEDLGFETSADALVAGHSLDRVALARFYIQGEKVLPYEIARPGKSYARWVADDLASLRPTYVSGLIRRNKPLAGEDALTPEEISGFKLVRSVVRDAVPGARFDVVLTPVNSGTPLTPTQITHLMANIQDAIHPDIWFFDFFDQGQEETVQAAIRFAHAQSYANGQKSKKAQLIGGNLLGNLDDAEKTRGADFYAIADDGSGQLNSQRLDHLDRVRRHFGKPVLVHTNNNPQDTTGTPFACVFNQSFSRADRKAYLDERARQAQVYGFTFMFNAFFPACGEGAPSSPQEKVYYDADHDGLLGHLASLMAQ